MFSPFFHQAVASIRGYGAGLQREGIRKGLHQLPSPAKVPGSSLGVEMPVPACVEVTWKLSWEDGWEQTCSGLGVCRSAVQAVLR